MMLFNLGFHPVGLPERKLAAACSDYYSPIQNRPFYSINAYPFSQFFNHFARFAIARRVTQMDYDRMREFVDKRGKQHVLNCRLLFRVERAQTLAVSFVFAQ